MPREPKYYVYTEQVRGEPRVWIVADRDYTGRGHKFASKEFRKEKPCRALCDRMNVDHERYVRAMIAKPGDAA